MDEGISIYGLEFQARALVSQLAENNEIRFFIATQSLKPNNQVHLLEVNDDGDSALKSTIFSHPYGEVWKLNSSPHDANLLVSCCSSQRGSQVSMRAMFLRLPDDDAVPEDGQEFLSFKDAEELPLDGHGSDVKTTEFHPVESNILATVVDGKVLLMNRAESQTRVVAEVTSKNCPKFTGGKWSQHHQGNQFITLHDCTIRSFDIRDSNHTAWSIEDAHAQLVRDIDCNPNKQCHIVTGGDDGCIKIWDSRNTKEAVFVRSDHSHWVWSVRFNTFHDQLVLSSSSDSKVLLTCASSVSSEAQGEDTIAEGGNKERLHDGLLQTFEQHEDSVYCVEWSSADPWTFASLSYDGRVIVSKVPRQYKYQILL
uniref:Putative wd repeat protein n=2 Tax=Nyssomyia neivai TaxID=330878 RepID=A0A1L8DAV6_9DIPT